MKKIITIGLLTIGLIGFAPRQSRAQSVADCIAQLVLNYQKLASLKNILSQMYNGYSVLSKGYQAVKGVAEGNFSLHEVFLDGLYLVSPAVRQYPRIADLASDQLSLLREYQQALSKFRQGGRFSPKELDYMVSVYDGLAKASLRNLDDLVMIVSDRQLRMSDAERLTAIDRLYLDTREQLSYLRRFNDQAGSLMSRRTAAETQRKQIKNLYGIN